MKSRWKTRRKHDEKLDENAIKIRWKQYRVVPLHKKRAVSWTMTQSQCLTMMWHSRWVEFTGKITKSEKKNFGTTSGYALFICCKDLQQMSGYKAFFKIKMLHEQIKMNEAPSCWCGARRNFNFPQINWNDEKSAENSNCLGWPMTKMGHKRTKIEP